MNVGIVLAAGRGKRFGARMPKQFTEALGKPVLAYTLEAMERTPELDALAVVCQPEYFERVEGIARDWGIGKLKWLIPGGDSCPESARLGLYALRGELEDDDIALLQMSVSPLAGPADYAAALRVCAEKGCCFTMHPVNVCMACGGGESWADTNAPKERFVELNSPWAFRYGEVYGLYRRLEEAGYELSEGDYTLGLWLADGRRAWYTRGSEASRLKITTIHDRDLLEGYLLRQRWLRGEVEIKIRPVERGREGDEK